jgi:hypothetical protein
MFGGAHVYLALHDTWTWEGTTWTRQVPSRAPPSRRGMGMAYDAVRGNVVVFGGAYYDGTDEMRGDTWTWDGTTWEHDGVPP